MAGDGVEVAAPRRAVGAAPGATGVDEHGVVLIISAVPTAPSAAVLAARLGGDVRLMASIAGVQTPLAAATIPLVLHWLT